MALKLPKFITNPGSQLFGSGYNPTRDVAKSYLQQMGNLSGAYQNRLARSGEGVQRFDPMYQAAVRTRLNYLQQQPFAAEEDALALGRASGAIADQYGQAQGNLARMLASRGISGGIAAGALANLETGRMGQRAAMQYQTALARIAARNQAQQEALGLLGGARSMYSGEEAANLAGLQGLYGNLYQGYSGLGAQEAADRARSQAAMGQLIGGVAGLYGGRIPTSQVDESVYRGDGGVGMGSAFSRGVQGTGMGSIGMPQMTQSAPPTRRANLLSRLLGGMRF